MAKKQKIKKNNDIDFFHGVPLLEGLTKEEVKLIYGIAKKTLIKEGTFIMKEGGVDDSMYLFYDGEVEVLTALMMKLAEGFEEKNKSMVKLNADFVNFFGEMSLLEDAPRSATIIASTDCIVYEIGKNDFHNLCRKYPSIGYSILLKISEVLCSRIRKNNNDIMKLTTALSIALE